MGYKVQNEEYVAPVRDDIPADTIAVAKVETITPKEITWLDKEGKTDDNGKLIRHTMTILEWRFRITEGEYDGRSVKGTCDALLSTHAKNRYRNWAETLLGREIPPLADLDTDDLIGLSAKIVVIHKVDKKDDQRFYVEVDELLPTSGGFDFGDAPF